MSDAPMNLRSARRFLGRLARLLAVLDVDVTRPVGQVALFSCSDVDRGMTEGGKRYSPLLEGIGDIVRELGLQPVNLTHPYAVFSGAKVKDGTITLNYRTLVLRLAALLARPLGRARSAALRERFEVDMYRRVLESLQPSVVFCIQPPFAMCLAARQAGVRVIEALHGTNISLGDSVFCDHMANPAHLLPHVMLAFDDVTHATFTALCASRDTVALRADDPWLHTCRRHRRRWNLSAPARSDRHVLITLQWGYDGERESLARIIPNGVLHPELEAAIAATAGRGITFWLRLHPIQMNSPGYRHHRRYVRALALRHSHVEFERPTALPLPLLLEEATGHITMSSSSVGEAAVAGVPSLMLCPTLQRGGAHAGMFRELERAGQVTFGKLEAQAIVDWIEQCPRRTTHAQPTHETQGSHQAQLRFYSDLISPPTDARAALGQLGWCEETI